MATIKHILETKGTEIWSVEPEFPVFDALTLMSEKGIGALLVMKAGQVVGIISERDYARKVVLKGKNAKNTPVSEIMTSKVVFIDVADSIDECMALMTEKRIRHLPVMSGKELVGIISIGDVVKEYISTQQEKIDQLENYIKGG